MMREMFDDLPDLISKNSDQRIAPLAVVIL